MERILSGGQAPVGEKKENLVPESGQGQDIHKENDALFAEVFDFAKPVVYYPVRHHSMGVSLHLKDTVRRYQPDCILIEGPENAEGLLPLLVDQETKPPFALYYSYRDKAQRLSGENQDYRCYYPFMECSPEYVALKEAARNAIPAHFIDLPYREILYAGQSAAQDSSDEGKSSYNDDHYLAKHKAVKKMCEQAGVRNYDEFWEKYFEINALQMTTEEYVRNLLLYCHIARKNTPEESLGEDGCLARESYMAGQIRKYQKQYHRILVVTGGFHTPGLYACSKREEKPYSVSALGKSEEQVYLMAYSDEALDALNGYASGMPFSAFYARVYREREKGNPRPFSELVLEALVQIAHKLRKKNEAVSAYDEICAFHMAEALASLRGKAEAGAYELYDAVLSNFVKGEWNLSTEEPLKQYRRWMMGSGIGAVSSKADIPPIVLDYEAQCRKYRIELGNTGMKERVLEIFAKPVHRQASMFFHRMAFLQTDFARRMKGPDLRRKKDKRLIRETWKYKCSAAVTAALIDLSVKGGTVAKACQAMLAEQLRGNLRAGEAAALLAEAFEMGLLDQYEALAEKMQDIFHRETDFYEAVNAISYLTMLYELQRIYQVKQEEALLQQISICYGKAVLLLDAIAAVKEEETEKALEAVKLIYDLVHQKKYHLEELLLWKRMEELLKRQDISPSMEGMMLGILYGSGNIPKERLLRAAGGYMRGSEEKMLQTASFLRGLFYTAKDLVFDGDYFVTMTDELIRKISDEEFVRLLPELRLAFSVFRPDELDRIAGKAAGIHGAGAGEILAGRTVPVELFAYASRIDRELAGKS